MYYSVLESGSTIKSIVLFQEALTNVYEKQLESIGWNRLGFIFYKAESLADSVLSQSKLVYRLRLV